jgi:serine/threonine-protein kinase HipA
LVANVSAGESDGFAALVQIGTSAGGARPKAVVAVDDLLQTVRSGQQTCPLGFKHYILKFDGVTERASTSEVFGDPQGYGRMEYAYSLMAKDCGIDMMPCHLLEEGGRAHFLTQRFDRDGDHKRHYQSLCAMAHADYKAPGQFSYEQVLQVMRKLRLPREDAEQLFRRMVFNVVARNHDDHTKNFGFLLNDLNSNWRLAPAFDVAFSYKPGSRWVSQHQMSVSGKRDGFTRKDLLSVADQIMEFKGEADRIISQVVDVVSQWPDYARQASVLQPLVQAIQANLRILS